MKSYKMKSFILLLLAMTAPTVLANTQYTLTTQNGCPHGYDASTKTFVVPNCYLYETIEFGTWDVSVCGPLENLDLSTCTSTTSLTRTLTWGMICHGRAERDGSYDIHSIKLPEGLTELSSSFFQQCENLQTVDFGDNSQLETIGNGAFRETQLIEVAIPPSVKTIGDEAFRGVSSLQTVNFAVNGQLETIGQYAFRGTSLAELTIPPSVKTIGYNAFYSISTLQTVNFAVNGQLETIGETAFYGANLIEVTIPASVITIERDAFSNIPTLQKVNFAEGSQLETIGGFNYCESLSNITIPQGVTTIGPSAFQNTPLTEITIPPSVVTIELLAFKDTSLTEVTIPASVTTIGAMAFTIISGLETVHFECGGQNIQSIHDNAFFHPNYNYFKGTEFTLPRQCYHGVFGTLDPVPDGSCDVTSSFLSSDAQDPVQMKPYELVDYCDHCPLDTDGQEATVWEGSDFPYGTYIHCPTLETVTFTGTVVPPSAFQGATALSSIRMDDVERIGPNAFKDTALSGDLILSKVTSIGYNAFTGTSVTSVTVPEDATLAGDIGVDTIKFICSYDGVEIDFGSSEHYSGKTCLSAAELQTIQQTLMSSHTNTCPMAL